MALKDYINIKAEAGLPEIHLFESEKELQDYLGYAIPHGLYNSKEKLIYATPRSLAHEIGHYQDHMSGRMALVSPKIKGLAREQAILRNEIVATLYAWTRNPVPQHFFPHEKQFLEYVIFQIEAGSLRIRLESCKLREIQDVAEEIAHPDSKHFKQCLEFFRHYLNSQNTY